jgi:hypothetical protein
MAVTVEQLLNMSPSEIDDLFNSSPAGAIPDGDSEGTVLLAGQPYVAPSGLSGRLTAGFARWLAWRGKVFNHAKGTLLNKITVFDVHAIQAKVYKGPSWLDGKEAIVLDYSKTSLVAHKIRDEIRQVGPGTYLGLVWWGRLRVMGFALFFPRLAATGG